MGKHVTRDLGRALRQAREERGLSLREASRRSQGRFTPSGIAGYERGERRISVERMCALAEVYGVRPERLLAAGLHPAGAAPVEVDLSSLERLPPELRTLLAGYIEEVLTMRGPADPDRISRCGRVIWEILAGSASGSVADLYRRMRDALADNDGETEPQPGLLLTASGGGSAEPLHGALEPVVRCRTRARSRSARLRERTSASVLRTSPARGSTCTGSGRASVSRATIASIWLIEVGSCPRRCSARVPRASSGARPASRFASTTSSMNVKSLDCSPSPWISGARPVEARDREQRDDRRVLVRRILPGPVDVEVPERRPSARRTRTTTTGSSPRRRACSPRTGSEAAGDIVFVSGKRSWSP